MRTSIGIVGAGIAGRLCAWYLVKKGYKVAIFDVDSLDGGKSCSFVGAGMLSPWAELFQAEPIITQLGLASLALWEAFQLDSSQEGKSPVFFQREGTLVLAHRQDWSDLEAFRSMLAKKIPLVGEDTRQQAMRELDATGISVLEPELGERFNRGLFLPGDGQIDARSVLAFLALRLPEMGVAWHMHTPVLETLPHQVRLADGDHPFDMVIDARGLGARTELSSLRGVRGELLWLSAPEVHLRRPIRLIHPRYPLYISPRPGNRYLAGATSIESDDDRGMKVKSALELLSAAYSLHPGFAEAEILESKVQLRPAFPDNLPQIHYRPGLIRINGLYRHGYLIGPVVAMDVVQLFEQGPLTFPSLVEESVDDSHPS